MSIIERERVVQHEHATNLENDNGVPRLRHICLPDNEDAPNKWHPMCGAVLPVIAHWTGPDFGPTEAADCVVCRALYVTAGGAL